MASSVNYKAPPVFSTQKPYSRWIEELKAWETLTDLHVKKRGIAVALSLPEEGQSSIRDKVFSELSTDVLNADDGVAQLVKFMDNIFKKDELSEAYETYTEFDRYKRSSGMAMEEYVTEFEKLYNRTRKFKMELPEPVLAFKLLECADLEMKDRQLVLTGVDYTEIDTLFKQTRNSLKKFFGRQAAQASGERESKIKVEPVFMVAEDVNYTGRQNFYSRGRGTRGGYRGRYQQAYNPRSYQSNFGGSNRVTKSVNPNGPDGSPLRCLSCDSIRHLVKQCPHSYENMSKAPVEKAVLFTGNNGPESLVLLSEATNSAVLDSACSSTVTGTAWMNCYLDSLEPSARDKVKHSPSDTVFKFGGGTVLNSQEKVTFPCVIAAVECDIETDVVQSDIPLLLSKSAMKKAKVKLDLENDSASIFGIDVQLQCTSSGHYCVPIDQSSVDVHETVEALMSSHIDQDKTKVIEKFHKQFAHPSAKRLKSLMKDAGGYTADHLVCVDAVSESCEVCKKYTKTPARPVVSLPLATEFNEVVAVDLKEWKPGVYFLHMIDMATRFSLATVIKRKTPEVVINKIMTVWIGSGIGPPKKFLADNGGEFANDTFRDMCQNLNIEVLNTAAYSPWQNGICERNHAVVDDCVDKILEDQPKLNLEVALVWAVNAKNSLSMVYGWSPYQLVYGANPNIPSTLHDKPPALENTTISETFAKHLNALHSSRRAFIQAESSERIRRALRHKIRASKECFEHGDRVYYKRDDDHKWKGPGSVIGQDGKIVFVRHGSVYVRVHPCRLIICGAEFENPVNVDVNNETIEETKVNENDEDNNVGNELVNQEVVEHAEVPQIEAINAGNNQEVVEHAEVPQIEAINAGNNVPNENNHNVRTEKTVSAVNSRIRYLPKGSNAWRRAHVISRGGKATGKNWAYFNIQEEGRDGRSGIDFVKDVEEWKVVEDMEEVNAVVIPSVRHGEVDVREAKVNELANWKTFSVYEEVPFTGQQLMSTRWVITEKNVDGNHFVKARLVVRGFEEENEVKSDSPTAHKESLRLFLTLSSTLKFHLHTLDVKAAFLQGNEVDRDIYVNVPKECATDRSVVWKLKKCVYGLVDASRNWFLSVKKELLLLGCLQSKLDPAVFYQLQNGQLQGLFLVHVDDFLWSGTNDFKVSIIDVIMNKFECGKREDGSFMYIGLNISQEEDKILLDQRVYTEELEQISGVTSESIGSKIHQEVIGQLHWISTQSRPDLSFDVLDLATATGDNSLNQSRKINKVVRKAKNNDYKMTFPSLQSLEDMEIVLFTDASHANLSDRVSSAGGHVVFLRGKNGCCSPITWSSKKIKRVVKSSLAAESLSMVDGIDAAFYLRSLLQEIVPGCSSIPIICMTDNKSLVENIHSTKLVSEKRLRLDLASIKESVSLGDIQVQWVKTSHQLSDCLTKGGADFRRLIQAISSGSLPGI